MTAIRGERQYKRNSAALPWFKGWVLSEFPRA